MAFRVNYNQQRQERERAKEAKKRDRLARREEDAKKRKAEREGLLNSPDAADATSADAPPAKRESE
jgi:hypothetical protein